MQAEAQSAIQRSEIASNRSTIVLAMAVIYIAIHAMWFVVPAVGDIDIPTQGYFVTAGLLIGGLVGIFGLWNEVRWGWWAMLVVCVVNVLLTIGDALGLEGTGRIVSIVSLVGLAAVMALLFRPALRAPLRG